MSTSLWRFLSLDLECEETVPAYPRRHDQHLIHRRLPAGLTSCERMAYDVLANGRIPKRKALEKRVLSELSPSTNEHAIVALELFSTP